MGSKHTGIMSLVHTIGKTDIVIAPELDKVKKGIGQPKIHWFVKKTICFKVKQYSKTYKVSTRQAFLKLCNLSSHHRKTGFYMLMDYHFKNKRHPGYWKDRMINEPDTQINFYKNHVKKWF
jgi:hypothetical protein